MLQTILHALLLTLDGYRQWLFINRYLKPFVRKQCRQTGYVLTPQERKKVLFYYPMFTVLACGEMYLALKGRRLNLEERERLTLVAAWATLCDDLVDEYKWPHQQVMKLVFEHQLPNNAPGNVLLLNALNGELNNSRKANHAYKAQLRVALEWQSASARQSDPEITLEEILSICCAKNGNTSLMFATLLDENWSEAEKAFIYQSAIVGQLTNDAFDMYNDTRQGVNTYFNTVPSITEGRAFFIEECRKLHALVRQCDARRKDKENTIKRMSILHAFTLTALDHLQTTENKYGAPVNWKQVPRNEMVTDMATSRNRWKTVKYMNWLAKQ